MKRLIRRALLPVLALGWLIAGCGSGVSSDEAAVIDGRSIGVEELQQTTQEINETGGQAATPAGVLNELTRTPILDGVLGGTALELTEQSVVETLRGSGVQDPSDLTIDLARTRQYLTLLQDPATQQDPASGEILERLNLISADDFASLGVEINPRYGGWDPAEAVVAERIPTWIRKVE